MTRWMLLWVKGFSNTLTVCVMLCDPFTHSILKFGVGITNDAKRLQDGYNVPVAGCVDLQHLAVRCGFR